MSRINALCLVSLLLTACSAGEADEAPAFDPSQAGSAGSAGQTSSAGSAGSAGAAGTTQLANGGSAGTGGTISVTEHSDECNFRGPYRVVVTLVSGSSSCSSGSEFAAALQGRDVDACEGTFCREGGGGNCVTLECDHGNPVPGCSSELDNGSGCVYDWTMVPG
jgi:hypothetical protein